MIDVSGDLRTLKVTSEHFKDIAGGSERYEVMRQRVYALHFLDSTGKATELPNLVSELAAFLPLEATGLNRILHTLLKSKDLKLDASAKAQDTYIKLLSMHEVGIDAFDREIKRMISRLALRHGVHTRLKLALRRRKIAKSMVKNHAFVEKIGKEIADEISGRA
ncbi:hypothetical protein VDF90_11925 [Xanthomonas campestris pv. raphani]|uniref:hypothetical protein n=1 Tax=Xanthomonas campestris TaxID=339 RepID=UPI002B227394|nr:hypothetical protein [Xanthomonas campestris]MEA9787940.1 hypothetical protein [Xanthomonas campestris pv. raphani]